MAPPVKVSGHTDTNMAPQTPARPIHASAHHKLSVALRGVLQLRPVRFLIVGGFNTLFG